eukprot:jgi/Bigna1/38690/e_gw1.27.40.1
MVGQLEGQFLKMAAKLFSAKNILDVGTFTGYSAMSFAEGLPSDGTVVTIENDRKTAQVASELFKKSKQAKKISLLIGSATDHMQKFMDEGRQFDIIFLDADKENYVSKVYYDLAMKGLLRKGGMIMADNTLCSLVYREGDMRRQKLHEFNEYVRNDPRVEQVVLTVREGISIIRALD